MKAERIYVRFGSGGFVVLFDEGKYRRPDVPRVTIYIEVPKGETKGMDDITDTPEGRCTLDSINERIAAGDKNLVIR